MASHLSPRPVGGCAHPVGKPHALDLVFLKHPLVGFYCKDWYRVARPVEVRREVHGLQVRGSVHLLKPNIVWQRVARLKLDLQGPTGSIKTATGWGSFLGAMLAALVSEDRKKI